MVTRFLFASGITCAVALAAFASASAPAHAQDQDQQRQVVTPKEVKKLYECREMADPMERLACYDAEVGDIRQKIEENEIAFADKYDFRDVTSTIVSASQFGMGRWAIVLEDGSRWRQTETSTLRRVRAGMPVTITKSGFGGFRAKIDNRRTLKVERVR